MGLTRSTKILILLAIDVTFFLVELIVGYSVGSLALVADSFHMLNDVMSLLISYYAIKLAAGEASSKYSYGWHRAEIVAALINGVFLLALCFSIFMEAIERFFSTPEISNPKLVVIVGSFGLASNILGLFLFHEHGHSHGHSHDEVSAKPAISAKVSSGEHAPLLADSSSSSSSSYTTPRVRSGSIASIYGHPAQTRAYVVQTAQDIAGRATSPPPRNRKYQGLSQSAPNPARHSIEGLLQSHVEPDTTPAEVHSPTEERREEQFTQPSLSHSHSHDHSPDHDSDLESGLSGSDHGHSHSHGGNAHGHGHGHGSMNMHALILHVVGDALGNVGVIATGLIIWLTTWSFKYYCDPIISLVITVIIFSSALPLVRSASFILLQGVPPCVSLDEIRKDILALDGVLSIHEFHIWQLSESKIVASVHVWVAPDREYMKVARQVRHILHDHGVHSSTVQPEVYPQTSLLDEHRNGSTSCLVPCPPGAICGPDNACCPPSVTNGKPNSTA